MNRVYDNLKQYGFLLLEEIKYFNDTEDIYTLFLLRNNNCLIIDVHICDNTNVLFSYADYTNKQNEYMFKYEKCFRFYIEDEQDLDEVIVTFNMLIDNNNFNELEDYKFVNRNEIYVDNSPLEFFFEDCFEEVYGYDGLKYLEKEYALTDINGNNIFIDYVVEKKDKKIAIEENGVSYHHPQIIGIDKYKHQLEKQNSLIHYNFMIFRWSTEHLKFKDKVCDSIKKYFGDKELFLNKNELMASRSFKLYEHQEVTLNEIELARNEGNRSFLVVLPTATGKSKIIEEDLTRLLKEKTNLRVLIMVPTIRIKDDWLIRIGQVISSLDKTVSFGDTFDDQIVVNTYISVYNQINNLEQDYFDYIVVDEAHHAVAPTAKKTIQHFNPNFLIGLTATPERLDKKRLEDIFGSYNTKISIEDAIKNDVIAPIRAYRIESNINLKEVRFNGKEYCSSDLERAIRVTSRNELIAKVLKKYFVDSDLTYKQGIIFCVNIKHTQEVEKILTKYGISAKAVNGSDKRSQQYIEDYKDKKIQFLCACNLISEGWDSPQTSILVMARPTLSKVLYLQQLGRGLRKYEGKECLYVIDVVDQYNAFNAPWSIHGIFGNQYYIPFGDLLNRNITGKEMVILEGLIEEPMSIREIDIFTFEQKFGDYLSIEQLARELFVSTGTARKWWSKGEIKADEEITFGSKILPLFNPDGIDEIRKIKKLKEHNEETIKEDFMDFINEKIYTFSFKMVFILAILKRLDKNGNAKIDEVLELYKKFYRDRNDQHIKVDRDNCIYTNEFLSDNIQLKQNMLSNPFEKFERKRFIYYCKDLSEIGFNIHLWEKLTNHDLNNIKDILKQHLEEYYQEMDGLLNIDYLL